MFGFLIKIIVCILVVFCIHTIWQTVQENYVRPKVKNTNAEIEKYKSLVEQISRQNQSREKDKIPESEFVKVEVNPSTNITNIADIESDLNSFLDSILIENNIEIMPVI